MHLNTLGTPLFLTYNSDRKQLKNFFNCEFKPIHLKDGHGDSEVLFTFPPDPLHINLLGAGNDCIDLLEKVFPEEVNLFFKKYHLTRSGQGVGGKFNGPSVKLILKEESLTDLEDMIPNEGHDFISYLKSIRELHRLCTSLSIKGHEVIIEDFQ